MSNWLLIPAKSAMSNSVKRTSITQYGLRILRNTKLELEWEVVAEMLSEFCERLRDSGYSERFRVEVMKSILEGWRKMIEEEKKGGRPINRPRKWNKGQREELKRKKKTSWYRSGGYSTVIFCPYTPNSVLAKRWREIEERGAETRGWRYRVVELGGRPIRSTICKFPWEVPCSDPTKCLVCATGGRGPCTRPGCTYEIQCLACKDRGPDSVPQEEELEGESRPGQGAEGVPCTALYHGELGYSAYTRGLEHSKALQNKSKKNALWRHCTLYHESNPVQFSMSVASTHIDSLTRKTREGVTIIAGNQDVLLNSKQEFLQGSVPSQRT